MPNKTEHYQLNQYEPGDNFLRTDFNEDNAKIDAAIAAKPEIVADSYTGNDSGQRVISLGFTPRAVVVAMAGGTNNGLLDKCATLIALPNLPVECLEVVEGGFKVWGNFNSTRENYNPYNYIAFK